MNKIAILLLISAMNSLPISEELKITIHIDIAPEEGWSMDLTNKVIEYLEGHPTLTFTDVMGAGSFGIVFKASKQVEGSTEEIQRAFKLQFDNPFFTNVKDLMNTYDQVKSTDPESYIIQMEQPYNKLAITNDGVQGIAGIEMELGMPGELVYFTDSSAVGKTDNTKKLYEFFLKLMKGFNYFNQVKGFYHADVKPDNWVVIKQPNGDIEPRIIDFDLIFRHPKLVCEERGVNYYQGPEPLLPEIIDETDENGNIIQKKDIDAIVENGIRSHRNRLLEESQNACNPDWAVYTLNFRPPELTAIVWETNFDKNIVQKELQVQNWVSRIWSSRFMEECWAIGASIQDAVHINSDFLDVDCQEYKIIQEVITALTKENKDDRVTLEAAIEYMEEKRPRQQRII